MKQCKQKCQEKKNLTNLQIIQKKELLVGKKKACTNHLLFITGHLCYKMKVDL